MWMPNELFQVRTHQNHMWDNTILSVWFLCRMFTCIMVRSIHVLTAPFLPEHVIKSALYVRYTDLSLLSVEQSPTYSLTLCHPLSSIVTTSVYISSFVVSVHNYSEVCNYGVCYYRTLPRLRPRPKLRPPPLLSESSCIGLFALRIRPPGSDAFVSERRKCLALNIARYS